MHKTKPAELQRQKNTKNSELTGRHCLLQLTSQGKCPLQNTYWWALSCTADLPREMPITEKLLGGPCLTQLTSQGKCPLHRNLLVGPVLHSCWLIKIINNKVFLKSKILSLETILSARTHTHRLHRNLLVGPVSHTWLPKGNAHYTETYWWALSHTADFPREILIAVGRYWWSLSEITWTVPQAISLTGSPRKRNANSWS